MRDLYNGVFIGIDVGMAYRYGRGRGDVGVGVSDLVDVRVAYVKIMMLCGVAVSMVPVPWV